MAKNAEKQAEVSNEKPVQSSTYSTANNRSWAYGAGAVALLVLFFVFGMVAQSHHGPVYDQPRMVSVRTGGGFGVGMHERGFSTGGQTRTQGVVTAVNGSDFIIAGQGSTTNVTTNSSTKYQGGDTVKQNDTVIVFGSIGNSTFTATQIIINP